MDLREWLETVSNAVTAEIEACYLEEDDGRWDENIITADILRAIKGLHKKPVRIKNKYYSTSWNAFKLKGENEQIHGDIAFIVKINFSGNQVIEGVAFIEAKRITHGNNISSGSFSSIKWDRLRDYSNSSTAHYTLLYDYLPIEKVGTAICRSMVTEHLLALNVKNRTILPHTERVEELLGLRLLKGYGLDYREDVVEGAKGFSKSLQKYKYVLTADVSITFSPDLVLDYSPVKINDAFYIDIDTPKSKPKITPENRNGPTMRR